MSAPGSSQRRRKQVERMRRLAKRKRRRRGPIDRSQFDDWEPSVWARHKWRILGVGLAVMAGLIRAIVEGA